MRSSSEPGPPKFWIRCSEDGKQGQSIKHRETQIDMVFAKGLGFFRVVAEKPLLIECKNRDLFRTGFSTVCLCTYSFPLLAFERCVFLCLLLPLPLSHLFPVSALFPLDSVFPLPAALDVFPFPSGCGLGVPCLPPGSAIVANSACFCT